MTPANNPTVTICACTYKRDWGLRDLFAALNSQTVTNGVNVVIVDNDPAKSAESLVLALAEHCKFPVLYVSEPRKNIAHARNACVQNATGEWIAFVDDDECPIPTWLEQLINTAQIYKPSAVFAPVLSKMPVTTEQWILDGGYFDRPRFKTGTTVPRGETRSGNVLIKVDQLPSSAPFDPDFGLTGGEDTALFDHMLACGSHFVWCDEAEIYETVTEDRVNEAWILKRAYRGGQTYMRQQRLLHRSKPVARLIVTTSISLKALVQMVQANIMLMVTSPRQRVKKVRWRRLLQAQKGKLSALKGNYYQEYAA